jgi:hypothetical protein
MTKKETLPSYPDFTGIEGFTKNKVVTIDKKLFDNPIYWQVKVDGMNVGCYLDNDGEFQIRSREQLKIAEGMKQRFLKLPYAESIRQLLTDLRKDYPDDDIILFGEFMIKGKSPTRIEFHEEDSFKAFDLYCGNLKSEPPMVKWESFVDLCERYEIPKVVLVEKTTVYTYEDLLAVRDRLMKICEANRWEGVVGKVWMSNEFGSFVNIVKEKVYIPPIPNPKNPENDLPDLPDSEITGAIEKVLVNNGVEKFQDIQFAMPEIARMVDEQCIKHGCKKPGKRTHLLYRERLMRM